MTLPRWLARTSCALLLAGPFAPAHAQSWIQVRVDGAAGQPGNLRLEGMPRLSAAALAAQVQPQAYLLGAALLRPALLDSQRRLKAGLLFDLVSLRNAALTQHDEALAAWAGAHSSWLEALPITGRQIALLDPRAIEANPEADVPLAEGDHLYYPLRPTSIRVVGAVERPCTLPPVPLQDARIYLASCASIGSTDNDWIYVIQPDGQVFQQGIALWNRSTPLALAPGAVIYRPLRADAIARINPDFNRELAGFLATQILPGPESAR